MSVKIIKDEKGKEHYVLIKEQKSDYWVRVPQKWWRSALSGLKPIERCILISLLVWGEVRPSKSQLAKELNTTRWTIIKYLKILKKKGLL
jgi:hypothetical protein